MTKWKRRAVELVTGLAFTGKENPSVVPYQASKTEVSGFEEKHFKRTTPERRGVSSNRIFNMGRAIVRPFFVSQQIVNMFSCAKLAFFDHQTFC